MDFKKFVAIWLSLVILGTVLTAGTLKMLYSQSANIQQSTTPTEGNNHFSVVWKWFRPSYINKTPVITYASTILKTMFWR